MILKNYQAKYPTIYFASFITLALLIGLMAHLLTKNILVCCQQGIWIPLATPLLLLAYPNGEKKLVKAYGTFGLGLLSAALCFIYGFYQPTFATLLIAAGSISFALYMLPLSIRGSEWIAVFALLIFCLSYSSPITDRMMLYSRTIALLISACIAGCMQWRLGRDEAEKPLPSKEQIQTRAIRMGILFPLMLFICHQLSIQQTAWVAASLLMVEQNTLGSTMRRAYHRLLGTIFGLLAGVPLSHYLFSISLTLNVILMVPMLFCCLIIIQRVYAWAMFIATVIVVDLFSILYQQKMTFIHFLSNRLLDTLLGLALAVIGSIFIFPRSLCACLQQNMHYFLISFGQVITDFEHADLPIATMQQTYQQMRKELKDLRLEPLSFLFKRYFIYRAMVDCVDSILKQLPTWSQHLPDSTELSKLTGRLQHCINLSQRQQHHQKPIITIQDEMSKQSDNFLNHQTAREIHQAIETLVTLQEALTKVKIWQLRLVRTANT